MSENKKTFLEISKDFLYRVFVKDWAVKLGCLVCAFVFWLLLSAL